jgi:hypothetical protein
MAFRPVHFPISGMQIILRAKRSPPVNREKYQNGIGSFHTRDGRESNSRPYPKRAFPAPVSDCEGSQRTSGCVGSRPYLVILREPPTATRLAPHEGVAPAVDGSKIAFEVAHSRDPNPTNPCSDVMSGWRVEDYPIT